MEKLIFEHHTMVKQRWVFARADGCIVCKTENDGGAMARIGLQPGEEIMTLEEAKVKWPDHADEIDEALAEVTRSGEFPG
jgi:hypothetical protein